MHTLRLSNKSLLLKIYRSAWPVNEEKVNFCKLFWGVLFSPVGYLLKLFFWPVDKVLAARRKEPLTDREWLRRYETKQAAKKAKAEARKYSQFYIIGTKVLKAISNFFTGHARLWETLWKIVVVLYCIVIGGWLIYWLIAETVTFLLVLAGVAITVGIIALIVYLGHNTSLFQRIWAAIKTGWQFLKHGYKSIKYRTCPLIEVTGDPSV